MARPVAFAVHAHPDDIEFMMAGTLAALGDAGYELHYMNIANGCCGSMEEDRRATAARRLDEAKEAADHLGAIFHPPLANDMEVFYNQSLLMKLAALVREVAPSIMLAPSPQDYMEDHMNACRLAVSAAFVRGMPNYETDPQRKPVEQEVTVYHALPWGLHDQLRRPIFAECYVDIHDYMVAKRSALGCHRSQKEWLDATQGLDSYLTTMEEMAVAVGKQSRRYHYAEGWRKHLHLGFCKEGADPLLDALGPDRCFYVERDDTRDEA